jgi:hypothetical protein
MICLIAEKFAPEADRYLSTTVIPVAFFRQTNDIREGGRGGGDECMLR